MAISERSSVQNFISGIKIYFPGGVEMRALLHAATDEPRPEGKSNIFLRLYKETGCWNENRRGPFPFDMTAWQWARIGLDEMETSLSFFFFKPYIDKCI